MKYRKISYLIISIFIALSNLSIAQKQGVLYGMTSGHPIYEGVVFSYDPLSRKYSIAHPFLTTDGSTPYGDILQANNSLLYGMTSLGGANGKGVIFSVDPLYGAYNLLFSFNSTDGSEPYGALIQASDGLLYGMTTAGGKYNNGVLFSFNVSSQTQKVLYNFNDTNGAAPYGSLFQASNGLLYGMTKTGGSYGYGVLFKYNISDSALSVLVNFRGSNGAYPMGSLIQGNDSILYGETPYGGISYGTLFEFNTNSDSETVLYNLNANNGALCRGSLLKVNNNYLYGMAYTSVGAHGYGTLFRYNIADSSDTALIQFNDTNKHGYEPTGSLIQSGGSLYGMTLDGGKNGAGTLFRYDTNSSLDSVLIDFGMSSTGAYPNGDLTEIMTANPVVIANNKCYGDSSGSATISVRGGHYPLKYLWSSGDTTDTAKGLKAGTYTGSVTDQKGIIYKFNFTITSPQLLKDSISKLTNVKCNGGSNGGASLSVTGGVTPYSFAWSSSLGTNASIAGVIAGSYTCTVTDSNGCVNSITVNISQPLGLKDSVDSTKNVTCFGQSTGKALINVKGGVKPYSYLWSSGAGTDSLADNLIAGTYTCIVKDANNCKIIDSAKITSPTKIIYSDLVTPTPCTKDSGKVSLTVSGGMPPYTYLWSNSATTHSMLTFLPKRTHAL